MKTVQKTHCKGQLLTYFKKNYTTCSLTQGDTDLGDIFRNRAAEERGETNTIRSDFGNSINEAYDNVTANAIDEHEGTAT